MSAADQPHEPIERAQRALRASEARYRRLFEAAKDGILILDGDTGQIVDVNPFMAKLTGHPRGYFLGKHLWQIGRPKDIAAFRAAFVELKANRYVRFEDLPLEALGGEKIDVEFVSNVYQVDDRSEIQCNIRDIRERKHADDLRMKLEQQLRASQKMEAIGGLAGGVAHDFNNLLSVILSYAAFAIEETAEGSRIRSDLLEVRKAAERAAELTRHLLAFSRNQVLQPVALDLNEIAAGIEKMLRRVLGEDIDFVQVLQPGLGTIHADPGQLEQVLMNLVVNARDAMPGGGKLTIETSNVELGEEYAAHHVAVKAGPYVMLAVTDTGTGMDAATLERIFEPFYTTKDKDKGTGLGLSTVYGIVKQTGGSIGVYSEPGHGTTFKVYLPRYRTCVAPAATAPAPDPKRVTGTETILVVEDEPALRAVVKRTLEGAGYTVLTAGGGEEALGLCEQHAEGIQLLLADVIMPRMSGKTLALELTAKRPALKVLYMSGYTSEAIVHRGVRDAGTHFLGKPFTTADLTRKVRLVLDEADGS